MVRKYWIIIII